MTRRIQQPGAPPGEYQRARTPQPLFRRVQLQKGADEPTYYWDTDGVLFYDHGLTEPCGLVIVAYATDDEEDEDD